VNASATVASADAGTTGLGFSQELQHLRHPDSAAVAVAVVVALLPVASLPWPSQSIPSVCPKCSANATTSAHELCATRRLEGGLADWRTGALAE